MDKLLGNAGFLLNFGEERGIRGGFKFQTGALRRSRIVLYSFKVHFFLFLLCDFGLVSSGGHGKVVGIPGRLGYGVRK